MKMRPIEPTGFPIKVPVDLSAFEIIAVKCMTCIGSGNRLVYMSNPDGSHSVGTCYRCNGKGWYVERVKDLEHVKD